MQPAMLKIYYLAKIGYICMKRIKTMSLIEDMHTLPSFESFSQRMGPLWYFKEGVAQLFWFGFFKNMARTFLVLRNCSEYKKFSKHLI